jgi:hypothetical protein
MIMHAVIISIQKKRRPRTYKVGVSIYICQVMFMPEHHKPECQFFHMLFCLVLFAFCLSSYYSALYINNPSYFQII